MAALIVPLKSRAYCEVMFPALFWLKDLLPLTEEENTRVVGRGLIISEESFFRRKIDFNPLKGEKVRFFLGVISHCSPNPYAWLLETGVTELLKSVRV